MRIINKSAYTIIILLSVFQFTYSQNIDVNKINSNEEVEKLIHSFGKKYENFELKPIGEFPGKYNKNTSCKRISKSLNITKSFYKSDFDNNGLTDILVIGKYYDFNIFVVMNFGNDSLQLIRLTTKSFQDCVFPKINNDTLIDYYYMTKRDWMKKEKQKLIKKTLIYKFGSFIEHNPRIVQHNIKRIDFSTTPCFGTCPVFSLSLIKNGKSEFIPEAYKFDENSSNDKSKGKLICNIEEEKWNELTGLINYIDFTNLKNNYSVNWTDDQSCTLKITYDNNKTKTIKDYGLIGTFGLENLYKQLFDLRFNQKWKKANTAEK